MDRLRNSLEQDPGDAWEAIRLRRWGVGARVTEDDDTDLHATKVCADCGKRLGHPHLKKCPQRRAT